MTSNITTLRKIGNQEFSLANRLEHDGNRRGVISRCEGKARANHRAVEWARFKAEQSGVVIPVGSYATVKNDSVVFEFTKTVVVPGSRVDLGGGAYATTNRLVDDSITIELPAHARPVSRVMLPSA